MNFKEALLVETIDTKNATNEDKNKVQFQDLKEYLRTSYAQKKSDINTFPGFWKEIESSFKIVKGKNQTLYLGRLNTEQ